MEHKRILRIVIYLILIVLAVLFFKSGYYTDLKNAFSGFAITGNVINQQEQIPLEISLSELSENPGKYFKKTIKTNATITDPEGSYINIHEGDAEFKISKIDVIPGNYEIIGKIRLKQELYYRYYRTFYYIDVKSISPS